MADSSWDYWVDKALEKIDAEKTHNHIRTIFLCNQPSKSLEDEYEVFDETYPWDRSSLEVSLSEPTFQNWLNDQRCSGEEDLNDPNQKFKKLLIFSGNDYLGLGAHPTVGKAASKIALEHGMGPKGSAIVNGYSIYHRLLESSLANLKKKEECLLCPTGYSANVAVMVAIGSIVTVLATNDKPLEEEKVAIFSDELNHASIIDGIRIGARRNVQTYVYKHNDVSHLDSLLSSCPLQKKVVVTDSVFSMDGDFAPLPELARLRKKHGFLFVIDDAHGSLVCGENGGGPAEMFNCEKDVDICVGTLSKAVGCHGGFIACSKRWKQFIQTKGRSFVFSTAAPLPVIAAAHASIYVSQKEGWRRKALWDRVQDFRDLSGIPTQSYIISLVVGSEDKALTASRHLLKSGFHVSSIRPPMVPYNKCRLRVTLSALHTAEDMKKLVAALSKCINFKDFGGYDNWNSNNGVGL